MLLRQESQCQRQARSAFTLMEMLIVVAIIVALAGVGGIFLFGAYGGAQEDLAKTQTGALTSACMQYKLKHQDWPDNLQQLLQKDQLGGPYLESSDALVDPWNHAYQYDKTGPKNNGMKPDIWAVSPNAGKLVGNWPKSAQQ